MFRKELMILVGIALAVFAGVAGIASLAVRAVQHDASMVVQDTLPGLVSAGEALDRLNENWFSAQLLLGTDSIVDRDRIMSVIETNSTSELWNRYGQSIYDERDAQLFRSMEKARTDFIAMRSNYFQLVRSSRMAEAKNYFKGPLDSAFKKYHRASGDIFVFNAEVGQQRADRIIRLSKWMPYVLAGVCVTIMMVGIFIGFKASLGAFSRPWTDKTSRES